MLRFQGHLSLLLESEDDDGVIAHPTAATECSL